MRYDDTNGGNPLDNQPTSLFDDAKKPKHHITRNGVKFQRKMLLGVLGVIVLGAGTVFYFSSQGEKSVSLEQWQSDRVLSADWKDTLELTAAVELQDSRALSMPEKGTISSMLVEEGDVVSAHQILAKIDPADLPDSLTSAQANLASQQRGLEKAKTQNVFTVRQSAQDLKTAQRDLADAQKALDLQKKLKSLGSASEDDVANAQSKLDTASDKIAQINLQSEQNAALYELNINGYEADIQVLKDSILDLNRRIALCTVTSPINGTILQIATNAREKGLLMAQYDSILTVANTSTSLLKAKLPESNASQVRKGLPVTVTTDSASFSGTVERIGALALTDTTTYGTYLDLYVHPGKEAPAMRSGAAASLTLNLGERQAVTQLKRGPWFAGSTQDYVFVVKDGRAVKTKITIGSATTKQVEIVAGLKPGDQVITSSYQAIAAYDSVTLSTSTNTK